MDENKKSGEMLSEQEKFWLGKFGDEYQDRNNSNELLAQKKPVVSWLIYS